MATLSWRGRKDRGRGVALVVHGLNQRPACMAPVVDLLASHGIGCVGLALRGHGDNYTPEPGAEGVLSVAARLASFQTRACCAVAGRGDSRLCAGAHGE